MGFNDDNQQGNDRSERVAALQEQQINTNKIELENKKRSLFQTKLDIIKGQGAQQWTPNKASPVGNQFPFG